MSEDLWTVKRVLGWIEGYLAQHGDDNARVSAQWLVSEALGVNRMQLFLDAERPLSSEERAILRGWTRQRAAGEPLQYITGEVAFRHITVKVRPGVLIPRPETEVLVSEALALLPPAPKPQDEFDAKLIRRYLELARENGLEPHPGEITENGSPGVGGPGIGRDDQEGNSSSATDARVSWEAVLSAEGAGASELPLLQADASAVEFFGGKGSALLVADIGTGTGCIACSIASEHPLVRVVATDLSPEAVMLARENVDALGLANRVQLVECDLGAGVDQELMGQFDLVVSNPPYIPTALLANLPAEVAGHEPPLALDGGADGLAVFRKLLRWGAQALKSGGSFACELHETCLEQAAGDALAAGYRDVKVIHDLAGRPRVLTAAKA